MRPVLIQIPIRVCRYPGSLRMLAACYLYAVDSALSMGIQKFQAILSAVMSEA